MKKTSRKAIRPKKARARTDHPAGCRVSDGELSTVRSDIDLIGQASGIKPSLGSYTKHALLSYPRYRRMEVQLRKLMADEAIESYFAGAEPGEGSDAGPEFYKEVKAILEAT